MELFAILSIRVHDELFAREIVCHLITLVSTQKPLHKCPIIVSHLFMKSTNHMQQQQHYDDDVRLSELETVAARHDNAWQLNCDTISRSLCPT